MDCTCDVCVSMCKHRPCWPTPEEAELLMKDGHVLKLMLDYWVADDEIYIVCPAVVGHGGEPAPFWPTGRCVFLDADDRCEIHHMKPREGRLALCGDRAPDGLHSSFSALWDTPKGKEVVDMWQNLTGKE